MPKPTSDCRATGRKHLWPMVRLGDVCTIEFGTRVRRKDSQGGDYPVYGGGGATFCWSTYNREDQCIVSRFAMSEECVRFVKGKFFLNDSGLSVRSDNQDLSQTYLDWVLYSKQPEIYALGRGAAQKNLDVEQFVDMMLPLPPLSVQREIVARLERELAAVEKMKKGLEALVETAKADYVAECRVIFERIAQEHPKVSLDDACEFIKDGTHQTPTYTDDIYRGYKFLSSKDVVTGEIDWSKIRYIPKSLHDELYLHVAPQRGDILLAKNGTTGIGALVETDEVFDIYVSLALLRFKAGNNPRYLWYAVNSPQAREQYNAGLRGSGVPNLHLTEIRKVHICLPSVQIQDKVVSELDAIKARAEKLEAKAREGVAVCETMRKAILKEAFDDGRASPAIGKATGR